MTEIGNRLGQAAIHLGVGKCWLLQKEMDKVMKCFENLHLKTLYNNMKHSINSYIRLKIPNLLLFYLIIPFYLFFSQALDSFQRAYELADGIGNKVC